MTYRSVKDKSMPAPAFWKGYLKLSLVTCPVALTPATSDEEKVRFRTINRKTGHRVRTRYVDSETGKPVAQENEIKGYETSEGNFVTFDDEELESVALESVRTIDIDNFVPAGSIPWIWYDKPYFLTPNDKVGEEAFGVIRAAMADKDVVGISRVVLFRRERAVLLEPRDNGIILWTLRYGDEVRDPDAYFDDAKADKPDPALLKLIDKLIDERSRPWDPSMVKDPVQEDLLALINSRKKAARPKKKAEKEETPSNVVNLMDALKKSLEKSGRKSK
jgi:DNA end-binding protein Ku